MTDVSLPTSLSFTDHDIAKASAKKELQTGDEYYPMLVMGADRRVGREGSKIAGMLQLNLRLQAMTDPDDPESTVRPTVYANIPVPIPNPDIDGHVVPDWAPGMCAAWIKALFSDEIPGSPRKVDGVWMVDGEEIDGSEVDEYRQQSYVAVFEKVAELWEDPDGTKDCRVFVQMQEKNGFTNPNNPCADVPSNGVLRDPDDYFAAPQLVASKANGKATKKKAKKKGRR